MGMTGSKILAHTPSTQDILTILMNAEKLFWSDLALITRRGHVSQVREAAISLALIRAFQTSLGKAGLEGPILTVQLLGKFRIQLFQTKCLT
jgi:separase